MGDRRIPGRTELYRISRELKGILFGNPDWRLNYTRMLELFDIISKDPRAPNPHKIPYGQAIDGAYNARKLLRDVGVLGSNLQKQSKQAITCAFMKLDSNYKVTGNNRKLLHKILPQRTADNRNKWINQCETYLTEYAKRNTNVFVNKYDNLRRNS